MKSSRRPRADRFYSALILGPTVLLLLSLVFEMVNGLAPQSGWDFPARLFMIAGALAALSAALPGLLHIARKGIRVIGRLERSHIEVQLGLGAVFGLDLWLRSISGLGTVGPLILAVCGYLLLGINGWLCGEILYRHRLAGRGKVRLPPRMPPIALGPERYWQPSLGERRSPTAERRRPEPAML
ncbi:MAG: hypothetical protein ABJD11_04745 [Gemmatimonadota bacterium]